MNTDRFFGRCRRSATGIALLLSAVALIFSTIEPVQAQEPTPSAGSSKLDTADVSVPSPPTVEAEKPVEQAPPIAAPVAPPIDRALAEALAMAFDPWLSTDLRAKAIASAAISDLRATGALVYLLRDADAELRAAAAAALKPFASVPGVTIALSDILNSRYQPDRVRIQAARSLAAGAPGAGVVLGEIYRDDEQPLTVREAARVSLEVSFPEQLVRERDTELVDRSGRTTLVLGSAVLGSFALSAIGALGENDAGIAIGAVGGLFLGGATAYLLTRRGEITKAQSTWMVSAGLWGAFLSTAGVYVAIDDSSPRLGLGVGLVGESLAFGAAYLTRKTMGYSSGDVAIMNFGGLLGMELAGASLLLAPDRDNPRLGLGIILGAGAVGLGAGAAIAPKLSFSRGDTVMTAETTLEGALLGNWIGRALSLSSRHQTATTLFGLGLGFVGGSAMSQYLELSISDVSYVLVAGVYGKMLGASIPMLADSSDDLFAVGIGTGSILALGAAYATTDRVEFSNSAPLFIWLSTAFGWWHGFALGESTDGLSSHQSDGALYMGAALGGLAAAPIDLFVHPTNAEVMALTGGVFWGTWFSAWGAALGDASRSNRLRISLLAGDVGLVASAIAVSPIGGVDPRAMGVANLAGLAGSGIASLGAALFSTNDDNVIIANLVGSGLGFIAGAMVAASMDFAPIASDAAGDKTASRGKRNTETTSVIYPLLIPADNSNPATAMGVGLALFD
jgi:hypothetical protein